MKKSFLILVGIILFSFLSIYLYSWYIIEYKLGKVIKEGTEGVVNILNENDLKIVEFKGDTIVFDSTFINFLKDNLAAPSDTSQNGN